MAEADKRFACFKNRDRQGRRRLDRHDDAVQLRKDKRNANVKKARMHPQPLPPPPPPSSKDGDDDDDDGDNDGAAPEPFDWAIEVPESVEEQLAVMQQMVAYSLKRDDVWLLAQTGWLRVFCNAAVQGCREGLMMLSECTMFNPATDELVVNAGLAEAIGAGLWHPELHADAMHVFGNVGIMGEFELVQAILGPDPGATVERIITLWEEADSVGQLKRCALAMRSLCRKFPHTKYVLPCALHHRMVSAFAHRLSTQLLDADELVGDKLDVVGSDVLSAVRTYITRRDCEVDASDRKSLSSEQISDLVTLAQPAFRIMRTEKLLDSDVLYSRAVGVFCALARVTSPPLAFSIPDEMMHEIPARAYPSVVARVRRDGGHGSLADYLVLCENVMAAFEMTLYAPSLTFVDQYISAISAMGFLLDTSVEMFESMMEAGAIQRMAAHAASPHGAVVETVTDVIADVHHNAWCTDAHLMFLADECMLVDLLCTAIVNHGSLARLDRLCECMLVLRERLPEVYERAFAYPGWIAVVDTQSFDSDGSNVRLLSDVMAQDDDDDVEIFDYRALEDAPVPLPFQF